MRRLALAALVCGACAIPASALDSAQWPPPPETAQRMQELRDVLIDPASTPAQRDSARGELAGLLKSPAGQGRSIPGEKPPRAARAAIEPFPSVVKPYDRVPTPPASPAPGVARIEVIEPPRAVINPRTGAPAFPTGDFAIDANGHVLHPVPGGFVDPRTGQVIPR